jgi:hypothetical protein
MGHCSCGYTIPGIDCVSATANTDGFTPLTSLMRVYPWNEELIVETCKKCNQKSMPIVLENLWPRLVLVPQSKGELNPTLTAAYAKCLNEGNVRNMHFSHYGFVQNRMALSELNDILLAIECEGEMANEMMMYIDIDTRSKNEMDKFLLMRSGNSRSFLRE